jgi:hypothetical protein
VLLAALVPPAAFADPPTDKIKLPPGFRIEVWAALDSPRAMTLGRNNTVYVGSAGAGKVYALKYDDIRRATEVSTLLQGIELPIGVAYRDGALFVSAVDRILRLDDVDRRLKDPPEPAVVFAAFPRERHHGSKFIAFGPDGKLYAPVGAPCNICDPNRDRYANIMRMNADGSDAEVFARGVRNTVGFDWHPRTRELWFTDNGRDWLGDDSPPCELNRAPRAGMHFGYPYCHGSRVSDPEYGSKRACREFTPPVQSLGPHVAPLGMRFYTGTMFPPEYRNQIFIAEHGSWNRSKKIGYRVTLVRLKGNRAVSYQPFAEGWLDNEVVSGRPADVLVLPDGSLLISDDLANVIYRVSYAAP